MFVLFTEFVSLKVPHSITLLEKQNLLCIADRENMRIVCVNPEMDHSVVRTQHSIQQADLGRVFAVANSGQGLITTFLHFDYY